MVVCGTGHRPKDTPAGFNRLHPWKLQKIKMLQTYLESQQGSSHTHIDKVISGFALGFDQYLAYTAIKIGIPVVGFIPFVGQERLWNKELQQQYNSLLSRCQEVKVISEGGYSGEKMFKRNIAMLNDSDRVLALWNPSKKYGGTWNTVSAALSMQKKVVNFWPEQPQEVYF